MNILITVVCALHTNPTARNNINLSLNNMSCAIVLFKLKKKKNQNYTTKKINKILYLSPPARMIINNLRCPTSKYLIRYSVVEVGSIAMKKKKYKNSKSVKRLRIRYF